MGQPERIEAGAHGREIGTGIEQRAERHITVMPLKQSK